MKKLIVTIAAVAVLATGAAVAQERKTVRIGTEGAYPPFNYIDAGGNLVGFDIDIAKALCEAAKIGCEFVVQDWDGIIPALLAKKYDAIVASMSITEERKQKVHFTKKYYTTPAKFVAAKDANIEVSKAGLQGKRIGVQRATVSENYLRDNYGDVAEVKSYATQEEANLDLISGRVDLVIADSVVLLESLLNTDDGKNFEFVGPDISDEKWFGEGIGIAIRKEDDDLVELLNKAIDQIRADGTYQQINAKYFDFDLFGN